MWTLLHTPNGEDIWVNLEAPAALYRVDDPEHGKVTRIDVSEKFAYDVKETPNEIIELIRGGGEYD